MLHAQGKEGKTIEEAKFSYGDFSHHKLLSETPESLKERKTIEEECFVTKAGRLMARDTASFM